MVINCKLRGALTVVVGCAGYLAVFLGVLFMAIAAVFLFFFRNQIGPLFVDDARVGREVAGVAPICAAYQMPDGVYGVASGVLRCSFLQASHFPLLSKAGGSLCHCVGVRVAVRKWHGGKEGPNQGVR